MAHFVHSVRATVGDGMSFECGDEDQDAVAVSCRSRSILGTCLLAFGGLTCGPLDGPATDAGRHAVIDSPRLAILQGFRTEGLQFAPAGPADAWMLGPCAAWLERQGLGRLRGPILASNDSHYAAVTDQHLLVFTATTCTRQTPPAVLADVVTDARTRAELAQRVAAEGSTAVADAPRFRFAPSDLTVPEDLRDQYLVPVVGGDVKVVQLAPHALSSTVVQGINKTIQVLGNLLLLAAVLALVAYGVHGVMTLLTPCQPYQVISRWVDRDGRPCLPRGLMARGDRAV
jgi:hypothetical protein